MMSAVTLAGSYLRRDRTTLIVLSAILYLFEVLIAWIARQVDRLQGFEMLLDAFPDFVRNLFGFDISLLMSFTGALGLGYFHPIVMSILIAALILVGRSPAGEVDRRTIELIAARPVRRFTPVAATLLEAAFVAVALPAAMFAGTVTGLAVAGRMDAPLTPYLALCANVVALLLCLGALFTLWSAAASRSQAYLQGAVGFAIAPTCSTS